LDFKQEVFSIISQFTGQNNVITVNVTLVDFVGDLETGLFLSQVIYWSDRGTRKDGFFYKTDDEWHQEIMLSKYSVRKARKKLEEMGLLETKVKKANGNPTLHYRFSQNRFSEMFISFLRNRKNEIANTKEGSCENEISLTEITTETTSETNNNKDNVPFSEIIDYLNQKTGSQYRASSRKTKEAINARWNEGNRLEDFKKVIDIKTAEWLNNDKMNSYLRPSTLFSPKFEEYLNQKQKGGGQHTTTTGDQYSNLF
jgi:uncharacterized phage protein (TIGR02220 family)